MNCTVGSTARCREHHVAVVAAVRRYKALILHASKIGSTITDGAPFSSDIPYENAIKTFNINQ